MKILFISSNLIGDSILSSGILPYLIKENPSSEITIVTGPTSKQLFENFPNLKEIIVLKKYKFSLHWLILWSKVFVFKWDLVIDMRSSFFSYLIFAQKRKIFFKNNNPIHQVKKISDFMKSKEIINPFIYVDQNEKNYAKVKINEKFVIAISPGGNWNPKIWPIDNYNKLIHKLQGLYPNKKLFFLIIGSKKEEKLYYNDLKIGINDNSIINIMGEKLTLTYAYLSYCRLFIGNDSGLMHLAAASGIPTIGLFGPTRDDWYGPFGEKCHIIRTIESYQDLEVKSKKSNNSLLKSIKINDLIDLIKNNKLL